MSSKKPRLRGKARARKSLYPLGEFPDDIVIGIARQVVHRLAVGHADITGDDFGEIFATAISGLHFDKPIGVTDVIWNGCSWSVKTVQAKKPFEVKSIRLISGRNSPQYSYGIDNPLEDISKTGEAVLNIWNQRVDQSMNEHDELRVVVFVRNMSTLEFSIFEYEAIRYIPGDYEWRLNRNKNLEAFEKNTNTHRFTWQPHGSQFTVIKPIPGSTYKFRITRHPGLIEPQHVLGLIGFKDDWVQKVE